MARINYSKLNRRKQLESQARDNKYDSYMSKIKEKATFKQKQLLKDLGVSFDSKALTKIGASKLIKTILDKRSEPKSIHSNERDDRTPN